MSHSFKIDQSKNNRGEELNEQQLDAVAGGATPEKGEQRRPSKAEAKPEA